ncbi:MAG: Gfo/Idh/MocA family oxidoreductase [Terrimicrobiaceae bacterium]
MRYDPLNQAVAGILEAGLLGAPLHAFFENYAGDTPLGPGHWFWKPQISGGIFIEHGIHFFDLFRMWFGPGEVVAAQQSERPAGGIIDQVHCTVRYGSALLANFYHGFHQSSRMESQETRATRAASAKSSRATNHFPPTVASASAAAPACRSRSCTATSCARCSRTKSARSRTRSTGGSSRRKTALLPLRSQSQPTNWREKPQALRPRKAHRLIFPLFANATENAARLRRNRSHLISMLALINRGVRTPRGLTPQQVRMNKQRRGFGCGTDESRGAEKRS